MGIEAHAYINQIYSIASCTIQFPIFNRTRLLKYSLSELEEIPTQSNKKYASYKKNLASRDFFKAYYDLGELAHIALYAKTNGLDE